MLYEADRHESLTDRSWDPETARSTIGEIVDDTLQARDEGLWPFHPRETGSGRSTVVYHGTAGVVVALAHLRDRGREVGELDLEETLRQALGIFRDTPRRDWRLPALLTGESGILLALYGQCRDDEVADRLLELVRRNANSPADDFMWGAPGTMTAALQMFDWTGEERWREAYAESASALWERWWQNERVGCHLWTQQFTGKRVRWVGACHGQFGNIDALLRGRQHLGADHRGVLLRRTENVLETLAVEEDELVNWPSVPSEAEPRMVQWCHGATGVVTALAQIPAGESATVDEYLERAGELVWRAGPLTKGHSICHGTSGSGFAMLKLWERNGESKWLERARRLAMHAVEQYRRIYDEIQNSWNSLYTGDPGLALFLQACLDETAAIPGLDTWPASID